MYWIPFCEVNFRIEGKYDDFVKKFHSVTYKKSLKKNVWYLDYETNKLYIGEIDNNGFLLEPTTQFSNNPFLKIHGFIADIGGPLKIKVRFSLLELSQVAFLISGVVWVFIFIFFSFISHKIEFLPKLIFLVSPIVMYFLAIFTFNIKVNRFISFFRKEFSAEVI